MVRKNLEVVCGKHPGNFAGDLQVYEVEKGLIMTVKELQMLQPKKEGEKMFLLANNFLLYF